MAAWYLTRYRADWKVGPMKSWGDKQTRTSNPLRPDFQYNAVIFAYDLADARAKARRRGLNEYVTTEIIPHQPHQYASDIVEDFIKNIDVYKTTGSIVLNAVHALNYLGMLAVAAKVATPDEIIGDQGIIHEFCHTSYWHGTDYIQNIQRIEHGVPGYRVPLGLSYDENDQHRKNTQCEFDFQFKRPGQFYETSEQTLIEKISCPGKV